MKVESAVFRSIIMLRMVAEAGNSTALLNYAIIDSYINFLWFGKGDNTGMTKISFMFYLAL